MNIVEFKLNESYQTENHYVIITIEEYFDSYSNYRIEKFENRFSKLVIPARFSSLTLYELPYKEEEEVELSSIFDEFDSFEEYLNSLEEEAQQIIELE